MRKETGILYDLVYFQKELENSQPNLYTLVGIFYFLLFQGIVVCSSSSGFDQFKDLFIPDRTHFTLNISVFVSVYHVILTFSLRKVFDCSPEEFRLPISSDRSATNCCMWDFKILKAFNFTVVATFYIFVILVCE